MRNTMGEQGGLLVVKRINWFSNPPTGRPVADRIPAVAGSHDAILRRYRGIEGEAWPDGCEKQGLRLEGGLASCEQYKLVSDYYGKVCKRYQCDLIHCQPAPTGEVKPPGVPLHFNFHGFDSGYYLSESNNYSSLFNEVIYGKYDELKAYARLLNDSLVLPSIDIADKLNRSRRSLIEEGADLETSEDGEVFVAIAIHVPTT